MKPIKKWLVLALALVLLGSMAGVALAGTTSQSSDNPGQVFLDKLAAALGIDRSTLDSALKDVNGQMVDEALQEGKITQQQADKMRSRISEGAPFFGMGMGKETRPGSGFARGGLLGMGAIADALGMSSKDLASALCSGKTLADLAAEKGTTIEAVQAQVLESIKARLDQEVADGKLSQSQADEMYSRLQEKISYGDWMKLQKPCKSNCGGQQE